MAASLTGWVDWLRFAPSSLGVKPTLPPAEFFKFPPANLPATLPPPLENSNYAQPFAIPIEWYNAALSPNVPITFALVYASVITYLNSVNKRRNKKPWAISRYKLFTVFVVLHNVFLSVYSLWTFIGMVNTLRISIANPYVDGLAATVDSFCKLNGPRGIGAAATYNATTSTWGMTNRIYHLAKDGTPEVSDVGRIWNEGLAYYGWIFYISKFYEVVDTLIILAKGKKSSFLQTYHHAGAMLCMWAGIRYMSPPIWLFSFLNSFIHFIMYTFYTVTTVGIKVPKPLKKALTTMQITQFVLGMSFAFLHYFVAYQIPVSTSYIYRAGESIKQVTSAFQPDASADASSWLKKIALRAAGREGLAENVENALGQTFGIDAVHAAKDFVVREETRYRDEHQWVHCLDTSGQTFAIYLNLFYLLPLTWLFLNFFIQSYLQRVEARRRSSVGQKAIIASQSINDARRNVSRRLSQAFEDYQGVNGDANGEQFKRDADKIRQEIRTLAKKAQESGQDISNAISEKTAKIDSAQVRQDIQDDVEKVKQEAQSGAATLRETSSEAVSSVSSTSVVESIKEASSTVVSSVKEAVENISSQETKQVISETIEKVQNEASNIITSTKETIQSLTSESTNEVAELATQVEEKAADATSSVAESIDNSVSQETKDEVSEAVEHVEQSVSETTSSVQEKAEEVVDEVQHLTEAVKDEAESKTEEAEATVEETTSAAEEKATDLEAEVSEEAKHIEEPASEATDATVQEGKSFADAAAEGVSEKDKGDVVIVDESTPSDDAGAGAEAEAKKEDEEGA